MSSRKGKRQWWVILCVALGVIAAIWIKVRVEAGRSLAQAEKLEARGEIELSMVCYRRTVRWYSPFSGPVDHSINRLWELAEKYDKQGHRGFALLGYRSIRSALLGIRSVYQPYEDFILKSSERIAVLMAAVENSDETAASSPKAIERHLNLLRQDHAPSVFWSLLATFGFLAWCLSLYRFAYRAFDDLTGVYLARQAMPALALVIGTTTLWLVALWQA